MLNTCVAAQKYSFDANDNIPKSAQGEVYLQAEEGGAPSLPAWLLAFAMPFRVQRRPQRLRLPLFSPARS